MQTKQRFLIQTNKNACLQQAKYCPFAVREVTLGYCEGKEFVEGIVVGHLPVHHGQLLRCY